MEQVKAVLSRRTAAAPDEIMPPWMALRQRHAPRRRGRADGSPFWPVQEDVRGHAARLDAPVDLGFFAKLLLPTARHACATSASAGRPEGPETKTDRITSRRKVSEQPLIPVSARIPARADPTKRAMRGRTAPPRPWRPVDGARGELSNGTRPATNRQPFHARQPERSHLPLSMRGEQVIQLALLPPEAQVGGSVRSRGLLDRHAQQVRARARLPEPPTPSQLTTPAHAASAGPHAPP